MIMIRRLNILAIVGCFIAVAACTHKSPPVQKPEKAASSAEAKAIHVEPIETSIKELLSRPEDFEHRIVTVKAVFKGWKGTCRSAPPETRSDWMIETEGECVYVSGPLPEGYSSVPHSRSIGQPVTVTGRVLLDRKGRPYIKVPGKP